MSGSALLPRDGEVAESLPVWLGALRYTTKREGNRAASRLTRLPAWTDLLNQLLRHANRRLLASQGREVLIVCDGFDHDIVSLDRLRETFLVHGAAFADLQASSVFVLPTALTELDNSYRLPFSSESTFVASEAPVSEGPLSTRHSARGALRSLVLARACEGLFAHDELERLVSASGGNLGDLFLLIRLAASEACHRPDSSGQIERRDANSAISFLCGQRTNRLGTSLFDPAPITWKAKLERLRAMSSVAPDGLPRDAVLGSLLHAHAVQLSPGSGPRFMLHPITRRILDQASHPC